LNNTNINIDEFEKKEVAEAIDLITSIKAISPELICK
jgi:hypothetical protein